jgi:head-tail adaptor
MNLEPVHFGQMDVRVTIEEPTVAVNATTSERTISGWTTFRKVWAKRISSSSEKFEANQAVALTGGSYMIRHLDGVTETMRVNDTALEQYHYILGIERVDRKRYLLLKTERRDNGEG